jgi:ATP-binding cassette subfamily F protein uup
MKHSRDIWIFDEPTNDLDLETIGILEEELRAYPGALIIVGHDRSFIDNVTDKCWVLHDQKIDYFEAGFSQAELFLEALRLEEELKKKTPPDIQVVKQPQEASVSKLTNKEKNRFEQLPKDIDKVEGQIEKVKAELTTIDFAKLDRESTLKMEKLQKELVEKEKKLEEYFEEWVILEKKN